MEINEINDRLAAGVAVRAAAAQSQDAPAGLGDRAEEKRVLLQPGHGAGEGERPGEGDLVSTVFIQVLQVAVFF